MYKRQTLEQVKAFHRAFLGASHAELSAVGDFDEPALVKQVDELLGRWSSPASYARIPWPFQAVGPLVSRTETPDKSNAVFIAGQNLALRDDHPDYPALVLGNFMLGGGFLNSRLAVRIRQKEGISYGVGSSLTARAQDENGQFRVQAIHAPQNTERLEVALREELARALDQGFTQAELDEARQGWLQSRQVQRAQDGGLAGKLTGYLFLDRTLAFDAAFEKAVQGLTPADVLAALKRHLDPSKLTVVRAGEFSKKVAAPAAAPTVAPASPGKM